MKRIYYSIRYILPEYIEAPITTFDYVYLAAIVIGGIVVVMCAYVQEFL